jgi:hypothetical protein
MSDLLAQARVQSTHLFSNKATRQLLAACRTGNSRLLQWSLRNGAVATQTVFEAAIIGGHLHCLHQLPHRLGMYHSWGQFLYLAYDHNHLHIVSFLIHCVRDASAARQMRGDAFALALKAGNLDILNRMKKENYCQDHSLTIRDYLGPAVRSDRVDVVNWFLNHTKSHDYHIYAALVTAAERQNWDVVQLLDGYRVKPDSTIHTQRACLAAGLYNQRHWVERWQNRGLLTGNTYARAMFRCMTVSEIRAWCGWFDENGKVPCNNSVVLPNHPLFQSPPSDDNQAVFLNDAVQCGRVNIIREFMRQVGKSYNAELMYTWINELGLVGNLTPEQDRLALCQYFFQWMTDNEVAKTQIQLSVQYWLRYACHAGCPLLFKWCTSLNIHLPFRLPLLTSAWNSENADVLRHFFVHYGPAIATAGGGGSSLFEHLGQDSRQCLLALLELGADPAWFTATVYDGAVRAVLRYRSRKQKQAKRFLVNAAGLAAPLVDGLVLPCISYV